MFAQTMLISLSSSGQTRSQLLGSHFQERRELPGRRAAPQYKMDTLQALKNRRVSGA